MSSDFGQLAVNRHLISGIDAYNTGIGWRNIIEKMHMTATLTKWYEEHGRHEIFAGGKDVPLATTEHLARAERRGGGRRRPDGPRRPGDREERARREAEGAAAKDDDKDAQYHEEMARLYRQEVLKEQPTLQIQGLGGKKKQGVQPVLHKPTV